MSEQSWLALWQRIGAQGNPHTVYANLLARYSESHRAYHTLKHIKHCMGEFRQIQHLVIYPDALELALWYHDAVYSSRLGCSEEWSVELAVEIMRIALLPDSFRQLVASLIMATKHSLIPADPDAKLIIDIDLSILGQSESEFDKYELQIRKEFEWVAKNTFIAGRSAILKSFIDRPAIYLTQFFHDKYEAQARRNIARSLA